MNELMAPFVQMWDWIDRVGGFPGKLLVVLVVVMIVIGGLTWFGNKR